MALRTLGTELGQLREDLSEGVYAAWVLSSRGEFEEPATAGDEAWSTYTQLNYVDRKAEARHTERAIGALLVNDQVIERAERVNKLKEDFGAAVEGLKAAEGISDIDGWLKKAKDMRDALSSLGRDRLHLVQCYRKIQIVHDRPEMMSFTWVQHAQSLRSIERDALQGALSRKSGKIAPEDLAHDRKVLEQLPVDVPLRVARSSAACPRVNLVYVEDGKIVQEKRRCLYAAMPILVRGRPGQSMPRLRKVSLTPDAPVARRLPPANSWAARGSILRTMTVYAA